MQHLVAHHASPPPAEAQPLVAYSPADRRRRAISTPARRFTEITARQPDRRSLTGPGDRSRGMRRTLEHAVEEQRRGTAGPLSPPQFVGVGRLRDIPGASDVVPGGGREVRVGTGETARTGRRVRPCRIGQTAGNDRAIATEHLSRPANRRVTRRGCRPDPEWPDSVSPCGVVAECEGDHDRSARGAAVGVAPFRIPDNWMSALRERRYARDFGALSGPRCTAPESHVTVRRRNGMGGHVSRRSRSVMSDG